MTYNSSLPPVGARVIAWSSYWKTPEKRASRTLIGRVIEAYEAPNRGYNVKISAFGLFDYWRYVDGRNCVLQVVTSKYDAWISSVWASLNKP